MAYNFIADRNYKVIEHLRKRFKDRFNIDLTRERRLDILAQAKTRNMNNLCRLLPRGAEIRRVKIDDKEFNVVYDVKLQQITTVLSPPDSPDFEQFCKDHPYWTRESLIYKHMTAKERTARDIKKAKEAIMKEIDEAYDAFVEEQKQKRIKESQKQLRIWQAFRKEQIKKEDARKDHE